MGHARVGHGHHSRDALRARCRVVVVSDTRTLETDEGGLLIMGALEAAGHEVIERQIVADEQEEIRRAVRAASDDAGTDVVILTGGTGITARDVTPEAVEPLLDRMLPGFGEAFRRLSFDEVGAHGLLSRAFAGVRGTCVVYALPGSKNACRTAMEQLVIPMLGHAVAMARG